MKLQDREVETSAKASVRRRRGGCSTPNPPRLFCSLLLLLSPLLVWKSAAACERLRQSPASPPGGVPTAAAPALQTKTRAAPTAGSRSEVSGSGAGGGGEGVCFLSSRAGPGRDQLLLQPESSSQGGCVSDGRGCAQNMGEGQIVLPMPRIHLHLP